jgi:group I intron endonuclease
MNSGIYCIKNLINNKVYIGQAFELSKREYEHFWALKNGTHWNKYLQRSFNKYGEINFIFEIKECCSKQELDEKEKYYINLSKSNIREFGYNMTCGGNTTQGYHHTEETKIKIGQREYKTGSENPLFGKKRSDETKKKISEKNKGNKNFLGRHHSEKTKLKISNSKKGTHLTDEQKRKLSEINKGKTISDWHKKRISESKKGIPRSEETKEKCRQALKGENNPMFGKHQSEETILKKSNSLKEYWRKKHEESQEIIKSST